MSAALLQALRERLGPGGVATAREDLAPHEVDWRKLFTGHALCVLRPRSVEEVSAAVRLCAEAGVAIVPQGGNTGMAGAATPDPSGTQAVLLLDRMSAVRDVDAVGMTMEVEAGCILEVAQDAARTAGRLLPLSIAAEGSATIGGVIATNAGGVNVLRYGMARELVLGLEVVLPDGAVVSGLRRLRKNNAGYDWKQLFIGSEGTLGVVTAAVLRLASRPRHGLTALLAVDSPAAALALLALAQDELGDQISAFELLSPTSVSLLERALGLLPPIRASGWMVLIDAASSISGLREAAEAMLATAFERGIAADGVIASSGAQAKELWALREHLSEAEARTGRSAKHDISAPLHRVPEFLAAAEAALAKATGGRSVNAFGHLGDGNIHYNVLLEATDDAAAINRIVHGVVADFGGSISAEHGVGRYRVEDLEHQLSAEELTLGRRVKRAIDPSNRFNPGKVYSVETP